MELAGIAAGGNMRSTFSDFDVKNAAELEAHINMNATAARINFEKYYRERLNDVSKLWRDVRRRLDVRDVLEVPAFVLDVGTSKFDYSTIGALFHDKVAERAKAQAARADGGAEASLFVSVKANMSDPFKLVVVGCDYTNVEKVVANLVGNTEVTHLSLANNGLEADDCDALAKLIEGNKTLVSLDLSNNKIGGEGMAKLAPALQKNITLTDVDLGANNLSKSAAKALALAISAPLCAITRLQLSGNQLGIYGAEELAVGLRANRSITALGLHNNSLGNDGAGKLLEILPTKGLPIDDVYADAKLPPEERKFNTSLIQISLDANRIDDSIALAVTNGTWLNEQVQMRLHIARLESEARSVLEDVDPEFQALELLYRKATEELHAVLAEKAAAAKAAALAAKAPSAKPGAKVPPKAGGPTRSASKSPEKTAAKGAAAPAPASSSKIKAAAGAAAPKSSAAPPAKKSAK